MLNWTTHTVSMNITDEQRWRTVLTLWEMNGTLHCPDVLVLLVLLSQVDEDVALDQAVKFCQIQLATSAARQVKQK